MALERDEVAARLTAARAALAETEAEIAELEARRNSTTVFDPARTRLPSLYVVRGREQKEVDDLILRQLRLEDTAAEQSDAAAIARAKDREEKREFWFRRFHLSIGLAHGAGLAAITGKIFDKDVAAATAAGTWWAMAAFSAGLVVAGLLPITLYREHHRAAWWMAGTSALLFVMALGVALSGAAVKAQHVWPFW